MMKVLVIVNSAFGYDGISNVAANYYIYQDKTKVSMDLATINPVNPWLGGVLRENGNTNYVLSCRNRNPIKYISQLSAIIKKNRYDVVHVHGNSATMAVELLAAKLAGCKVRIAHSHNTKCDHKLLNKLLMPVFSLLYTDCCACSVEAGQFLFGSRECFVVNNGLDLSKYRFNRSVREKIRSEFGLEGKLVVGHIGRFAPQKNHEFLIRAFAELQKLQPDSALLLVGQGELADAIKEQVQQLGLADKVVFYGTTDKVYEVAQAMDVFAFPSIFEGLGIVALEAQASGIGCVASNEVPAKAKCVENMEFLPLDGQEALWAERLLSRAVTAEEREQSADYAKRCLSDAGYDIEENCHKIFEYYDSLVERRAAKKGL